MSPAPAGSAWGAESAQVTRRDQPLDVDGVAYTVGQDLAGHAPVATLHLLDHATGHGAKPLATHRGDGVGQRDDQSALLVGGKNAFDDTDLDEGRLPVSDSPPFWPPMLQVTRGS